MFAMSCSTTKSSPRNTFEPSTASLMITIKIKIAAYDTSSADEIFGQRTLQSVPRRREAARLPPNKDRGAAPLRTEVLALPSQSVSAATRAKETIRLNQSHQSSIGGAETKTHKTSAMPTKKQRSEHTSQCIEVYPQSIRQAHITYRSKPPPHRGITNPELPTVHSRSGAFGKKLGALRVPLCQATDHGPTVPVQQSPTFRGVTAWTSTDLLSRLVHLLISKVLSPQGSCLNDTVKKEQGKSV